MQIELRDFVGSDAARVNRLALEAFHQYRSRYEEWELFSGHIARMAALAESAELIVASADDQLVGAVAYVAPDRPKASLFAAEWAVMRMLVVAPSYRGNGVGRRLAQECLRRAERDGAAVIALHTSPIMQAALALYRSMGFEFVRQVPPIHGVPYDIYCKQLRHQAPAFPSAGVEQQGSPDG